MLLPESLQRALGDIDAPAGLATAVARLTQRYRVGVEGGEPAMRDDLDRAAYLAVRMPATTSAVAAALHAGRARCDAPWTSVLDLGSGPGSALWAACTTLEGIERCTAVERDPGLIKAGRALAVDAPPPLARATWITADLCDLPELPTHDLVIVSYALGELIESERERLIDRAWALAGAALLIVEPGTTYGFAAVLAARNRLLATGATIAAPCTHAQACPRAAGPDWCRFSVRVPRSRLHRAAKGASLGHEDEPYSYLLASRDGARSGGWRLVAPAQRVRHEMIFSACGASGIERRTVSKRDAARWTTAKRLEWGDLLDEQSTG